MQKCRNKTESAVTAFNSIPRGLTILMHYVGLSGRQLKVVLKYSVPQGQNSVFMQQSTVLEVCVLTLLEHICIFL